MIKLSNGLSGIIIGRTIVLKIDRKYENLIFFFGFLATDISLNNSFQLMKLYRHVVEVYLEGTVFQVLFMGPSFCFKDSTKKV